jgi:hypothetical protein
MRSLRPEHFSTYCKGYNHPRLFLLVLSAQRSPTDEVAPRQFHLAKAPGRGPRLDPSKLACPGTKGSAAAGLIRIGVGWIRNCLRLGVSKGSIAVFNNSGSIAPAQLVAEEGQEPDPMPPTAPRLPRQLAANQRRCANFGWLSTAR